MSTRIIRTEEEHHAYLEEVERLIARGKRLSPNELARLEVLTVLIEAFENATYQLEPPDPIDAILFRMEERGLKQADLIPYFGTSSRVSEVLNRKRPLTVQMIRALSVGLGISTDTLVGLTEARPEKKNIDWSKFPIREMVRRGWLERVTRETGAVENLVKHYIEDADLQFGAASFRRSLSGEALSPTTQYALYAWLARVVQSTRAKKHQLRSFEAMKLSSNFLRELAQLSWSTSGPRLAVEFLQGHGISVVVEPHLKGTQLDGAALRDVDGTPIIGLTLRYDRLDNFWFTLMHEVVHIWRHVTNGVDTFVDDLNVESADRREAEANRLAREAFVPRSIWKRSSAYIAPSVESIEELSRDLRIHPSIIVGRLRKELGDYTLFPDLVGQDEVREALTSVDH